MVENKKVVKDHIISDGDWCWAVPILAYQAHRDGDGNEIKAQYATKNELADETNARVNAVEGEALERRNADNLKLDIPQFVFEGSEEGNECYIAKGTDDFVPPEGVIPIANIGNLTVTGSLNYSKMVTIDATQAISGGKTFLSAPWFHGTYTSFRSYTKFSDYKQSDTPSDKRMYIHSIVDNVNTNIGHVEMGTDNNGARDYLSIAMRGSGSGRNGMLQLRANYMSDGVSLNFLDPVGDGAGALWMSLYQSHINPSENGNVVAPLSYLNNPEKATYLVHRAGTETITGDKRFKGATVFKLTPNEQYSDISFYLNNQIANRMWIRAYDDSLNGTVKSNAGFNVRALNPYTNGTAVFALIADGNGNSYATCPTPNDNAPANAIVTKEYPKMVTTDIEQTLSAQKTIRRGGEPKIVLADTRGKTTETPSTTYYNDIRFADTDLATQGQIRFAHRNSGAKSYTLRLVAENGTVVNNEIFGVSRTGEPYCFVPTPSANANSLSAVNIAYVSATDGTTNNLVHNIGNEHIEGHKYLDGVVSKSRTNCVQSYVYTTPTSNVATVVELGTSLPQRLVLNIFERFRGGIKLFTIAINSESSFELIPCVKNSVLTDTYSIVMKNGVYYLARSMQINNGTNIEITATSYGNQVYLEYVALVVDSSFETIGVIGDY